MTEIYFKQNTLLERPLGTYANGTTKMVFCQRFDKKCVLASGVLSKTIDKYLYKMGLSMSFEELEELVECLSKATKAPSITSSYQKPAIGKEISFGWFRRIASTRVWSLFV
jgi:hypothetical protein